MGCGAELDDEEWAGVEDAVVVGVGVVLVVVGVGVETLFFYSDRSSSVRLWVL